MTCKPCEQFKEERIAIYMRKFNLSRSQAEQRFKKVKPLIDNAVRGGNLHFSPYRFLQDLTHSFKVWDVSEQRYVLVDVDPDYTKACNTCVLGGNTTCNVDEYCEVTPALCRVHTCTSGCTPLPNSTCTSTCGCNKSGCTCALHTCGGTPSCSAPFGLCSCNCNAGFHWDAILLQCVPNVVPQAGLHPSKPLAIILSE